MVIQKVVIELIVGLLFIIMPYQELIDEYYAYGDCNALWKSVGLILDVTVLNTD